MAKKKKSGSAKVAGLKLSKPAGKALRRFISTPIGREIAAAALTAAATTLITKFPKAAAVSTGSGVVGAAKSVAGHTVESVVHVLHSASDRLRHGVAADHDGSGDGSNVHAGQFGDDTGRRKGKAGPEDDLLAGLSAKQLRKLAKALRHA
ncbi:hypothetical protein [Chthonobacter rhizosphaerae]|uniref:hypothetical protein n=1 Tax=Chthonobacter rhizosphaerae TaxID=2735553 RepID=UPI0015EF564B|nr:hypothetical protein [Chthonobacter rhizosphaerae]